MSFEKPPRQTPINEIDIPKEEGLGSGNEVVPSIKEKITERISEAEKNPISLDRCAEIEDQINKITADFVEKGFASPEDILREDAILVELIKSSAMAYNIVEFKELLEQIEKKYNLGNNWVNDLLAHENAHANVLERQNAIWKGYGVIFMKDESGTLSNLQPLNFSKSNPEWGPKQMLTNSIESTRAPLEYGGKLSDADTEAIKMAEERLAAIAKRDEDRLKQVRTDLGI